MKKSNFALRLQPSLLEEARSLAKEEGVALNQFINVAVAEKLGSMRAHVFLAERARGADIPRALEILRKAGAGNRPLPGDELPADVRIDERCYVRIDARRKYILSQPVEAFKETAEKSPMAAITVPAGQEVFADPDYWKGVIWNGFEIVKFTLGPEWLISRRDEFLRFARPIQESEAIPA